ncbi:MAG TPA: EamA family transporter [Patescibacteria group bacterium]|nr:EamA family transporter [Patescibacteria group bacterium]
MTWLSVAIIAYFLLALVNILDKFLLENAVNSSRAYTFLVGVLGMVVFVLAPWFLRWPGIEQFFFNILIGTLFPLALLFFYAALRKGEASKTLLLVGGAVPVFTLIFSLILLNESFSSRQWLALSFLLVGTIIISWLPEKQNFWHKALEVLKINRKKAYKGLILASLAAIFFSLFFIGSKEAFNNQEFFSAFIWIRGGSFIFVLLFLFHNKSRKTIFKNIKKLNTKKGSIFIANQGLAAGGFLMQNYAISLTSVALVNALQGVQYVFIIIIGVIATLFFPKFLSENISKPIIIQKIIAVILIAFGLYLIAYA